MSGRATVGDRNGTGDNGAGCSTVLRVSCSRTYATLRIFSENLDPTDVTSRVGITPTAVHVRGDRRGGNAAPYRHGMWSLSTMAFESLDVREHIDQLLDMIEPAERVLAKYVRADNPRASDLKVLLDALADSRAAGDWGAVQHNAIQLLGWVAVESRGANAV